MRIANIAAIFVLSIYMLTSSPLWCLGYLGALFWDRADEMICCLMEDR